MSDAAKKNKTLDVVVIGSGFAGLGTAIKLKEAGIDDFVILEQDDGVGGTWRANHYPGAACDIESHLYSFSFEPMPEWSRMFAPQKEILAYLERCADKYHLRPHLRFGVRVVRATFDEDTGTWEVRTAGGDVWRARSIVAGCGGLSRPALPDIPGLDRFAGKAFHSARWEDDAALAGKRVAVIGTGASAIQIVPEIAREVGQLTVFQRTPPWILPKPDRDITGEEQARFRRRPAAQWLAREVLFWKHELMTAGFVSETRILAFAEKLALKHLRKKVADDALRAKLTPSYRLGCKRILLSNDYYDALVRPNVDVVTAGIQEVVADGIVTRDGALHRFDAIVLATGFVAAEQVAPFEVRGRGGRSLADAWESGAEGYLGTTVTGFPNFFFVVGPNTGLGSSSMVLMIEAQIAYVLDAVRTIRREGLKLVDVRPEAQARYNERLHARLAKTVWASGCASWYRTKTGKNTTLWPGFTLEFRWRTRRFDRDAYELVPLGATAPRAASARAQPGWSSARPTL